MMNFVVSIFIAVFFIQKTIALEASPSPLITPSLRSNIDSFKVMDVLARANELEEEGRVICHMEAGQPSTSAPKKVLERAMKALQNDRIGYTSAVGTTELRQAVASHYIRKYQTHIDPQQVIITTGSSGAFLLSFLGFFDPGDAVAIASAGYPCYRNIMQATQLEFVTVPINSQFKLTANELQEMIRIRQMKGLSPIKGLILSSPSNPTGAMLSPQELQSLCKLCDAHNIIFMSDEIYHSITYGDQKEATALQYSKKSIVINSFSKYYSMTGWRLGWMVVPLDLVPALTRLAQNLYINAPTLSQLAAVEAFHCSKELDAHVTRYRINRDIVINTLHELGLDQNIAPADGAFYIYVDLTKAGVRDSVAICRRILEEVGVALTPGVDFEDPKSGLGRRRIRFSFCRGTEEVKEAMFRFSAWWKRYMMIAD